MTKLWEKISAYWQDSVNLVLGVWLVLTPWIFSYTHEQVAAWNAYIIGAIIAVAALAAMLAFHKWEEWVNFLLGAWLVLSPWVLGFTLLTTAKSNAIVVGLLVAILALWSVNAEHKPGQLIPKT